jgi:hypothetical protein
LLQEIRDALDDDAVFNVVGEILPAAHVERVLRGFYAGRLGEADMEDRLLREVDEGRFRAICQNALEGLASKKLNLEMLIERRARAQERRLVPETIARFLSESAEHVSLALTSKSKVSARPAAPCSSPPTSAASPKIAATAIGCTSSRAASRNPASRSRSKIRPGCRGTKSRKWTIITYR